MDGAVGRIVEQGYGPGNVVNLLRLMRGDLRGLDRLRLDMRQVNLPGVELQDTTLAGAHVSEAVLGQAGSAPPSAGERH